jgi:hypothetical protein
MKTIYRLGGGEPAGRGRLRAAPNHQLRPWCRLLRSAGARSGGEGRALQPAAGPAAARSGHSRCDGGWMRKACRRRWRRPFGRCSSSFRRARAAGGAKGSVGEQQLQSGAADCALGGGPLVPAAVDRPADAPRPVRVSFSRPVVTRLEGRPRRGGCVLTERLTAIRELEAGLRRLARGLPGRGGNFRGASPSSTKRRPVKAGFASPTFIAA